jgi:hypothetical protein
MAENENALLTLAKAQMTQAEVREFALKNFVEMLATLERRLKVASGYINRMRDGSTDYEFIVKLAVLSEAITTQALVSTLHNEGLFEHFAQAGQGTRLNLCVKLGVLREGEVGPLRVVAQVRNQFAHRIENLEKTLAEYVDGLRPDQKVELVNRLHNFQGKDSVKASADFSGFGMVFRSTLFELALSPLLLLAWQDETAEREREREKLENAQRLAGPFTLAYLFRTDNGEVKR